MVEQKERPVPLEEVEIESLARNIPEDVTGYWTRRIAGALREDLGPVLVFAPHRREAEKIARDVAARIPCPQPLRLTKEQEFAAGPELARLLSQRVAFHHSGLSYQQRAGLVEPLAKGGQLRVVVATLGLSAGINFSLRSVLVTGTSFTAGRHSARGLARRAAANVRPRGPARARRPGLRARDGTFAAARPGARGASAPRGAAAVAAAAAGAGGRHRHRTRRAPISSASFSRREFIPLGIESTQKIAEPLPCGLRTDTGRARLVRRVNDPAPFCIPCPHREECLQLDPKPTLIWLWNRLGLLDKHLQLTRRGRLMAHFSGAEGLGVVAGLEDEKYPLPDLLEDIANLAAGDRFSGNEPRWAGRLAYACQKAYRRFQSDGFLADGVPVNYGAGGAEIVRALRTKKYVPMQGLEEQVRRGDVDRLLIEWKSLLRQVASAPANEAWPRWTDFQQLCRAELRAIRAHRPADPAGHHRRAAKAGQPPADHGPRVFVLISPARALTCLRRKQSAAWSFTIPTACMNA